MNAVSVWWKENDEADRFFCGHWWRALWLSGKDSSVGFTVMVFFRNHRFDTCESQTLLSYCQPWIMEKRERVLPPRASERPSEWGVVRRGVKNEKPVATTFLRWNWKNRAWEPERNMGWSSGILSCHRWGTRLREETGLVQDHTSGGFAGIT